MFLVVQHHSPRHSILSLSLSSSPAYPTATHCVTSHHLPYSYASFSVPFPAPVPRLYPHNSPTQQSSRFQPALHMRTPMPVVIICFALQKFEELDTVSESTHVDKFGFDVSDDANNDGEDDISGCSGDDDGEDAVDPKLEMQKRFKSLSKPTGNLCMS
ncbi:hypothetical protein FRC02_010915 [Tulasnella sp. 418]|nr:hypothetical protein FRC02_010915 [Tulasnella sp. 418]